MRIRKPRKYTFESIKAEALKYKARGEFQRLSKGHYRAAHQRGVLEEVCGHMPKHVSMAGKNSPVFKWSDEKLKEEALKYTTVKDFVKNSRSAYFTAVNRGILDKICSHLSRSIRKDWTEEELLMEALKFQTRSVFAKNSNSAYIAARKRKILDKICVHMKKSCGVSFFEQELFKTIKKIFLKTQKLRDSKVKIEGKPHIQGFDIDIYVPELRKGIEFDGTYHHSLEGMKRSRNWWPEEDLVNYHQIKDKWFASKGIQVLHIKEKEWIKNKEVCVSKCLNFLGVKNG